VCQKGRRLPDDDGGGGLCFIRLSVKQSFFQNEEEKGLASVPFKMALISTQKTLVLER